MLAHLFASLYTSISALASNAQITPLGQTSSQSFRLVYSTVCQTHLWGYNSGDLTLHLENQTQDFSRTPLSPTSFLPTFSIPMSPKWSVLILPLVFSPEIYPLGDSSKTESDFAPPGDIGNVWRHFWLSQLGNITGI